MTREATKVEAVDEAEQRLHLTPAEARATLVTLTTSDDREARVRARAALAIADATARSGEGLRRARTWLDEAASDAGEAPGLSAIARGRLAQARGYLAHREANDDGALRWLDEAAALLVAEPLRRARVLDTLGMVLGRRGDLDGARDYFALSLDLKRVCGADDRSLALTLGNLGRLALVAEQYDEAERWLRRDLDLARSAGERPATVAHVRNQLALALAGQGRHAEARAELLEAIAAAPAGTITRAYALKDASRSALADGDLVAAAEHLRAAQTEVAAGAFGEVAPWLDLLEAELLDRAGDPSRARPLYERAWTGFVERLAPPQACEAALAWARSLIGAGDLPAAREVLQRAARMAELHLFRQENPLARIESAIEETGPDGAAEVLRGRVRRMLGGVDERWLLEQRSGDYHRRRLRGARSLVTVWTCDLRGFTEFCARTDDPAPVVAMLNRFFARIGQALLDRGGCIDKYVGDSILAYFTSAEAAVAASHDAFARLDALNTERAHLNEPALAMGVGLATGWVVEGNIGFAGKLEHTIIGTPVNTACRLVARASSGQTLLDESTAQGLAARHELTPLGHLDLKGLGPVETFALAGPAASSRRRLIVMCRSGPTNVARCHGRRVTFESVFPRTDSAMLQLHQFPRTWDIPNPSPACLAVETYLRMCGLPFEVVETRNAGKGPKAKLPLLVDDGEVIPDAGQIVEHLKRRYGGRLDPTRRARGHLIRRTFEENLYWVGLYMRWLDEAGWGAIQQPYFGHLPAVGRRAVPPLVRLGMRVTLQVQGMGRHSQGEVYASGCADLSAVSQLLGDDDYLGGDEPASVDAVVYGFLANLLWVPIETPLRAHARTLPNLVAHAERIRDRFYATRGEVRS